MKTLVPVRGCALLTIKLAFVGAAPTLPLITVYDPLSILESGKDPWVLFRSTVFVYCIAKTPISEVTAKSHESQLNFCGRYPESSVTKTQEDEHAANFFEKGTAMRSSRLRSLVHILKVLSPLQRRTKATCFKIRVVH